MWRLIDSESSWWYSGKMTVSSHYVISISSRRCCLRDDIEITKPLGSYMLVKSPGRVQEGEFFQDSRDKRAFSEKERNLAYICFHCCWRCILFGTPSWTQVNTKPSPCGGGSAVAVVLVNAGWRSFYPGSQPKGNSCITQHFPLAYLSGILRR